MVNLYLLFRQHIYVIHQNSKHKKSPRRHEPSGVSLCVLFGDLADEVAEVVSTAASEDASQYHTDPRPCEGNAYHLEQVSPCGEA